MNIWHKLNQTAADAVSGVRAALVQIRSEGGGIGAGTIWHPDGMIITSAHVIAGRRGLRRSLEVELADGDIYPAQVMAYDLQTDIAALAIDASNLPSVHIGHSSRLKPGQYLMALGHPFGVLDALTAGVVIGQGDKLPEVTDGREWVALDMRMRPGHSGGPLFTPQGEVVGINTLIRGPGVSFAVPVDVVKRFLKSTIGRAADPIGEAAAYRPGSPSRQAAQL